MATESKSKYFHSLGELQADQEVEQALKDNPDWLQKQKEIEQAFKVLSDREQQKKKLKQRKDMSDGFRPKESDAFVDAPHYKDPRLEKPALQLPAFDKPQDYSIGKVPSLNSPDSEASNSFLLAGIHEWVKDGVEAGKQLGEVIAKEDANVTSRPQETGGSSKDAFVREQSYMSEQAKVDKAAFEKFGRPIDFDINRSAFPKEYADFEKIATPIQNDIAQKILGEDVTIEEDVNLYGVKPRILEIASYLLHDTSLDDVIGRSTEYARTTKKLLELGGPPIAGLMAELGLYRPSSSGKGPTYGRELKGKKKLVSARREPGNPFYTPGSAHNVGNATDLFATWDKKPGAKTDFLIDKIKPSLEKAHWTMIPTTNDKSVATVKTKKTRTEDAKDQAWMKFKNKEGEILLVELDDTRQHLHIHLGENQLEPTEQWK